MTKMHLIAKIMLVVVGIHLLVQLLNSVHVLLISSTGPHVSLGSWPAMLVFLMFVAVSCSIVYYLLFRQDKLVRKVAGIADEDTGFVAPVWVSGGFRLTLVLCGILIIAGSIEFLINAGAFVIHGPRLIIEMIIYKYIDESFTMPLYAWIGLFAKLLKTLLGIYLLLGAPQYVQWQINRLNNHSVTPPFGAQTNSE
ncbi:MAG: hypothetical protein ACYTBJ_25430 [Planctomycetota bacterium]